MTCSGHQFHSLEIFKFPNSVFKLYFFAFIAARHILGIKYDLFLKNDSVLKITALYVFILCNFRYFFVISKDFNFDNPYGLMGFLIESTLILLFFDLMTYIA